MTAHFDPSQLSPEEAARRRHGMVTIVLLLAGPAVLAIADLHWRTGFDGWKLLHLVLFTLLFLLVALGAAQAVIGFALRRRGGDACRIVDSVEAADEGLPIAAPIAIVMPVCNEDVARVIEGLRAVYESVERTGRLPECHFFLLSDSTDPNCWIGEEAAWLALTRKLGAHGRIFYRKRRVGINQKAGNLADFCRRWGRLYRYMIVLDADNIMTGDAAVRLVRLMEHNHRVGIIQCAPLLVNGETVLARLQQFATRLYGPVSAAGLNYWQLSEGNYWGHNAIIRLAPFIRHCSLPELPGEGPFGGRILSHDYVEAALMRRAGWDVWLAADVEGNYEEGPVTIIDYAKRDRRWLQGNLQHARLIAARGFHGVNRVHFMLGILAYLASPMWLAFLLFSTVIAANSGNAVPDALPDSGFAAYLHWSYQGEAVSIFLYTIALLFLPKALALLDLRTRPDEVAAFGGWEPLIEGALLETLVFTLLAPILMLFHTWFVFQTLSGRKVAWGKKGGGAPGELDWVEPIVAHAEQTALGVLGTMLLWWISPWLVLWMSPILAGLILSIPLSYLTASRSLGRLLRQRGLLNTPEENRPPPELARLSSGLASRRASAEPPQELFANYGLLQAVLDPYVNAAHVSLLRTKGETPVATGERLVSLRAALLRDGPKALNPRDRIALLMDADSMLALHRELWATPASRLAEWWRLALKFYTRLAPPPQSAFVR